MNLADRSMAVALATLRRLGGLEVLDRLGMRGQVERSVHALARGGGLTAGAANRNFGRAARALTAPARQTPVRSRELFDLTPTEEQQMLQEAFRDFATAQLRPAAQGADADSKIPPELLAQANELGVLHLAVPTEMGGVVAERSTVTAVLAAESLAYGDLGLAASCLAPAAVSTALALWGDADQQARYLDAFTGDNPPLAAFALMEPHAPFDPTALRTRAHRDGDHLVLQGEKALVPHAAEAELFVVAADLGDGPGLVLVESGSEGIGVRPDPAMGLRATATGRLHLEGVRVPAGNLLAEGDPRVYAEAVQRSRLAWAALAVGTAQAALDYLIPYVNERVAFGEPISHRQSVAFTISDIAIELEGMRLATYRAAALADRGGNFARPAALARSLVADKGMQIGSDAVQLLGGHGFVKEHPVERWYRDLRAAGLLEGALLV